MLGAIVVRTWSGLALLVGIAACGTARRASVNAVDPQLRAKGRALERGGERGEPVRIGDYEIESLSVEPTQVDPEGPLAGDDVRRPIVQHHLTMRLRTPAGQRWDVECLSQRRQSTSADYAAVAGINRDDVAVRCDLSAAELRWKFVTEAGLGNNFRGRLTGPASAFDVEVLVNVQRWGWLTRPLPDPVAQVRTDERTVAAMLLGRPEQAWMLADLPGDVAASSLATMLALRHLPLGLDE
jgi:hypothetical protein